jgi:eukaryotic-like serine/threonine-protein kinase
MKCDNPQLIGCRPGSGDFTASAHAVPDDLLKEAAQRLGILSLIEASLWALGTILYHLALRTASINGPPSPSLVATDLIAVAGVLVSIALYFYTRRSTQDPRFILDLGLVYMVLSSFALGLTMHWYPGHTGVEPMITWIGAMVVIFAAIVPSAPVKMLAAGLIAVSMNPLGMLIAKARGTWDFGPSINVLLMHYPDYLLAGTAVLISRVVTKLGRQVATAREMGSYRLVARLGKGGMGEVWRASHRMLARDAAIKLILPDLLSRGSGQSAALMRRRFEQEARTTASLRSPHTVELYDFGVTEDGAFYYVMEMLDGIDLERLVKQYGPQPPERVVHILRQVCRSLAEAHDRGMVHRDIKPTNIFLCRMGNEYDFAKVLDFGLVKVLDDSKVQMTGDGVTTGTPAFMPPELATGSAEIDGRCDLYGLGCVAYWLLTGGLVFEESGATPMMLAHVQKTPVAPSQRTELRVPESLDRAILMCLAKAPADRPASAEALARMLGGSEGVGAWTPEDASQWWRTHMPGPAVPRTAEADYQADSPTLSV